MDMDSSSSYPNWLAFSLSNHSLFPSTNCVNSGGGGGLVEQHQIGAPPKFEDFLGGSSGGATADVVAIPEVEIYDDSELKTIAAGFLQGFGNEQSDELSTGKKLVAAPPPPEPPVKKAVETFGQRTSIFRGVTRHRWTGRYEAHLWDNSCRREGQSRKGRQVYLGGYDKEEKAARAYDLAALKYWGPTTTTNFPVLDYEKEMEGMKHMTKQEFVASLRRKSSGFSRGASIYRGVTRHHQHGRWQARIGRVAGNKDLYLGTFTTQEEAAEAYDIAAIKFRGLNAVTNFDMSRYDVQNIATSNFPIGGTTNKPKTSFDYDNDINNNNDLSSTTTTTTNSSAIPTFSLPIKHNNDHASSLWTTLGYQNPTPAPASGVVHIFHNNINGTTPYSVESINGSNNNPLVNGYYQQHSNGTSIAADGTSGDAARAVFGNRNNWTPVQPFRSAKTGLPAIQTPIYGLE